MVVTGVATIDNLNSLGRVEVVEAPLSQVANITIKEILTPQKKAFVSSTTIKEDDKVSVKEVEGVNSIADLSEKLGVELNSSNLEQGQVLFLRVSGFKNEISVNFLGKTLSLITLQDDIVAFAGIDAKQTPGNYDLVVTDGEEEVVKKIFVNDARFPVTKIVVTPKLEEQGFTPENIVQSFEKSENVQLREAMEYSREIPYFDKPFRVPLDKKVVVGNFGNIRQEGEAAFQHLGVDLDAAVGDSLYAMNNGKIIFQKELPTYGKTLIIDHGVGIFSIYLHLDQFLKNLGEEVLKGELVGRTGNTGYSIEPHLHLSLKINGASVDPLEFIKASEKLE